MSDSNECSSSASENHAIPYDVISKPSNVIKTFNKTIRVAESFYEMTLITMKRSFLLAIENVEPGGPLGRLNPPTDTTLSSDMLIQSFMSGNNSLKGLSLAIGGHSTCLIASEHSLASLSLASRLSRSLNNNGPVYVANNTQAPSDTLDQQDNVTSLYERIFQFVRQNYKGSQIDDRED
jgi:hypothetical protein